MHRAYLSQDEVLQPMLNPLYEKNSSVLLLTVHALNVVRIQLVAVASGYDFTIPPSQHKHTHTYTHPHTCKHIHTWLLYRRYGSVSTCAWILNHPSPSLAMKQPVNWRRPTHNSSEHWTKSGGVLLAVGTMEENPVTNLFIATALNLALKTSSWALPSLLWCARELIKVLLDYFHDCPQYVIYNPNLVCR